MAGIFGLWAGHRSGEMDGAINYSNEGFGVANNGARVIGQASATTIAVFVFSGFTSCSARSPTATSSPISTKWHVTATAAYPRYVNVGGNRHAIARNGALM